MLAIRRVMTWIGVPLRKCAFSFVITIALTMTAVFFSSIVRSDGTTSGNVTANAGADMMCYGGESISFNGTAFSTNPITNSSWAFGDGEVAFGDNVTHVYHAHGTFIATYTATDGIDTASDTVVVVVRNSPPSFIRPYDMSVIEDAETSLNISNYITDVDDALEDIKVTTSSEHVRVDGKTLLFLYEVPMVEEVTVYVSDGENSVSQTITVTVISRNDAPIISPLPPIECAPATPKTVDLAGYIYDEDNTAEELIMTTSSTYIHISGLTMTLTYPYGIHHEIVNVTVSDGIATSCAQFVVLVKDTSSAPVVGISVDGSGGPEHYTLEEVNFTATITDLQDDVVMLFWDFGDGEFGVGQEASHVYSDDGVYTVKLTALDAAGKLGLGFMQIEILNTPPVPKVDSQSSAKTYQTIAFDASSSYDADGSIVNFTWELRDGTTSYGAKCMHAYSSKGTYLIILRVLDDDGAFSELYVPVTIENTPPIAIIASPGGPFLTGENITFVASSSYDPDGLDISYKYDFGDGTESNWSAQSVIVHVYSDGTRTYTVKLTVRDRDGAISLATTTVTVQNRAPRLEGLRFSKARAGEITEISLICDDPDGKLVRVEWDFDGDGKFDLDTTSFNPQMHTYEKGGVYKVKARIFDDDGASASLIDSVVVEEESSSCSPWVLAAVLVCIALISIPLFLGSKTREAQMDGESSAEQLLAEREAAGITILDAESALDYAREQDETGDFSNIEALIQQAKIALGKNNARRALNLAMGAKNEIEQRIDFQTSKVKRGGGL